MHQSRPGKRATRRALLAGLAIGACSGALAAGLAVVSLDGGSAPAVSPRGQVAPNVRLLPVITYEHGLPGGLRLPAKPPRPGGG
jgi:hypothetical protein